MRYVCIYPYYVTNYLIRTKSEKEKNNQEQKAQNLQILFLQARLINPEQIRL